MEKFKPKSEEIKESLARLITELEQQGKYNTINQYLKDFQKEFQLKKQNKNNLLHYLDKIFEAIIHQFPNETSKDEEDKKILGIISEFNIICQSYIQTLKKNEKIH
ncbi:MAG TPA: hypothetical protein VGO63_04275 [Candidatus Paceibacterota bacterium]|jgi:hypothetical protein|nr:hypothetical protein [Candidatus Paceibacterota bacterium]